VLEGRVVIGDCGCWIIRSYQSRVILRFCACGKHVGLALAGLESLLEVDRELSVSALEAPEEEQLWLT